MAVRTSDKPRRVRSTGAVKTSTDPVTTTQPADNTSTGAVESLMPGTVTVEHYGADPVVVYPTPTEPVTVTLGWMTDDSFADESGDDQPEVASQANGKHAKVVTPPPAPDPPRPSPAPVETK